MVKIGIYLPIYGGWFPISRSGKAQNNKARLNHEEEKPPTYDYVKKAALEAEKIGIDSLWIPDHLLNPIKGEHAPSLEAWTLATAIAETTMRVKIVHTTLCEAFRYPAVLAKQAATLSEISNGRFWLSIGAGWYQREYEAYGLPFFKHDDRVDRAKEAIQIIKKLWQDDNVNYKGKYYSIIKGTVEPKPKPIPHIWYAGMSEASLELIAKEADGWLMRGCSTDDAKKHVEEMKMRLRNKGRSKVEIAIPGMTFIRDTDEEARNYVEYVSGNQKDVLDHTLSTGLLGSPENIAQKIRELEAMGISHVIFQLTPTLEELKNVRKVLPILY